MSRTGKRTVTKGDCQSIDSTIDESWEDIS